MIQVGWELEFLLFCTQGICKDCFGHLCGKVTHLQYHEQPDDLPPDQRRLFYFNFHELSVHFVIICLPWLSDPSRPRIRSSNYKNFRGNQLPPPAKSKITLCKSLQTRISKFFNKKI